MCLRYRSILLNGDEVCEREIKRKRKALMKQMETDLKDLVPFDDKEPDWKYDEPWSSDKAPKKNLVNPKLEGASFTFEAKIYASENSTRNVIWSNQKYGYGFEWMAPNKNNKKQEFRYPYNNTTIGT